MLIPAAVASPVWALVRMKVCVPLPSIRGTGSIGVRIDIAGIGRAQYAEAYTHQQHASQSHWYSSRVSPLSCHTFSTPEQGIQQKVCRA
jgi:hypothetical protein